MQAKFIASTLTAALAFPIVLTAPAAAQTTGSSPVGAWASDVWSAARSGDESRLEAIFDAIPADDSAPASVERLLAARDQLRANRTEADEAREESRLQAMEELRAEVEAGKQSMALRKAVEVQTLSRDLNDAFADEELMGLVTWASDRIPEVEREANWLEAQELLYLLRTFYEDTSRRDLFYAYDTQLQRVNQRVGLIARYSPRKLHEMRNAHAEAMGEEGYGEFNAATSIDWRERLEDIDHRMLKSALHRAATEHIEDSGWRPLLTGGLDEVRLLATTDALAGTFPTLADAGLVTQWVRWVDSELEEIDAAKDGDLNGSTLRRVLDDLIALNDRTIRVPQEVVLREFGDGAMAALDTYSDIVWPDELRRFEQQTAGNFVGVGILIRHNDKRDIMVVNPLEGTPAYFAGVKPGDLIVEVDGDSTVGWSLNDAVDRITGPRGTEVEIGLKREGVEDAIPVRVVRDVIKIHSVKGWWKENLQDNGDPVWDWYVDPSSRIAYIRLTQFTQDTYNDLRNAWREITAEGDPAGLVLDLRHNPGGLLTAAVRVSNLFVDSGQIVTGETKDGRRAWGQRAHPQLAAFAGVPTVVLVNKGSASASEIVAGCLQAHGAAVILGERSFGKGSVQTVHSVATNAQLKLTTQYYRLPSPDGVSPGRLVHKRPGSEVWGVDPDIEVPMTANQVIDSINLRQTAEVIPIDDDGNLNPHDESRGAPSDLITKGVDPQLETALLILKAQAVALDTGALRGS